MHIARVALALSTIVATAAVAQSVTMNPDDVVAGRRAAYYLSGALVSEMQTAVEHGADPKDELFAASMIANWARVLPRMFADGTNVPRTHANPNVWTDRAGFEAKAADYAAAAEQLATVSQSGDKAAFLAQLTTTRAKCKACHEVYHRKEQPTDGKH